MTARFVAPADVPVVDAAVVARLKQLRDQVARPGEDVLGELLGLFERDARARLALIEAAVAKGAAEDRRQAAHALKGSAGNVGAARVAATAAHVEKNEPDRALLDDLARELEDAIATLRVRLA